ncbi:hypothetical protein P170DRAFT_476580 [Aspergillus steynii IBT 23096]|uniref:F-box domain-containing protein n=1 Tax=Aspergillus steynii IBT 23096 TaxID=1392250 RepID=A0A2I2G4Y1_9EURO|nr:uncharacterized protein P170DRAFT_476580 [Aspergillus steynii IBT 23096]PLB47927.1 hypothetical protein P170DRAFT_476580 [Aspergillus steynii IBT 23096]
MSTTTPPDPSSALHLYSLPNEVFVQILTPFSMCALLRLATISHRFHALVLRILHYRLLTSASLREYKLILECFHPSSKLIEPHVFCQYLGTDGLSDRHEGAGSLYENVDPAQRLGRLTALYSRFRPERAVDERISGMGLVISDSDAQSAQDRLTVTRNVNLETFEEFSQLCVVVNIVKVMPGTHLLLSANDVVDGVARLFREWLKEQELNHCAAHDEEEDDELDSNAADADAKNKARSSPMLWVDQGQNVGLKVRVRKKRHLTAGFPLLIHRDEEVLTSYEVDIEELHVRTTRLLLTMEKSQKEQQNYSQAVIFTRGI